MMSQGLAKLSLSRGRKTAIRTTVAAILTAWFATVATLAQTGALNNLTVIGLWAALPIAIAVLLLFQPSYRRIVDGIPQHWLIGVHTLRNIGFIFLVLADMHLLPDDFAAPAGYGDVLVGLLAPSVAYLYFLGKPYARGLALGWNALGLLDLISAVSLGIRIDWVGSSPAPEVTNLVLLIPLFAVPIFASLHLYSILGLLRPKAEEVKAPQNQVVFR
jgi:hypothetical protein